MKVYYSEQRDLDETKVVALYEANNWSAAKVPEKLLLALRDSHYLISAWCDERLIGLGNSISDGHLVVYYPHLLVLPEFQGKGVGSEILRRLKLHYEGFHMHMLTADGKAVDFYQRQGFERAGATQPMWIYDGQDH
ncbi:GNAT family N-acetyltransferase [Pelagicoccus albus]|uniref:GNAT family N-acetyltransferase n=1 Tax=Pelagicoccus albus TaxID=415222 RepID=A0A7X1B548_9BACT|nr:GNAT family N-acetyltransferase [Pelagicoccus albus]MBC2605819.1 GNAT family N-acetyltransferase [Pelagicoccus albus]